MSAYCKSCGEYKLNIFSGEDRHKCPPTWECLNRDDFFNWRDEREVSDLSADEFEEFSGLFRKPRHASDAETAAGKHLYDACHSGDGLISEMTIYVRASDGTITRHETSAELAIETYASKGKAITLPNALAHTDIAALVGASE